MAAGKGKGPPRKGVGKGKGQEPFEAKVELPKPQPAEALKKLSELQRCSGEWPEIAEVLGLEASAIHIASKGEVPSWSTIVSTTLARQALQRCVTLVGGRDGRSQALAVVAEHSLLGDHALEKADEWLESAWAQAQHLQRSRQRTELELKVNGLLQEQLPLPSWKVQLKAKMAVHQSCEVCGSEYTAAVGKCLKCFPPARSSMQVDQEHLKWRRLPPAPLHVNWKGCEGVLHVEGGSGGVSLLHVAEGVLVMKKQRMSAAGEFLAIEVAKAAGIPVADMRLVSWADPEFREIQEAVRRTPAFTQNPLVGIWRSTEFLGILEYIKGCTVQGPELQDRLKGMEPEDSERFWFQVGEIVAFDALINNVDRIPLLWDNEGNTANLMLCEKEAKVMGIDQAVAPIVALGPGRERYLARLNELCMALFHEQESPAISASFERVSQCFQLSCGVAVESGALRSGLLKGLGHIADLLEAGTLAAVLDDAIARGNEIFQPATVDMGHKELPLMREFLLKTAATIASARR